MVHWFIILIYCDWKGRVLDICSVSVQLKRIDIRPQNYGGWLGEGGGVCGVREQKGTQTILRYNMLLTRSQFWDDPSLQHRSQSWILSKTVIKLRRNNREDRHLTIYINFIYQSITFLLMWIRPLWQTKHLRGHVENFHGSIKRSEICCWTSRGVRVTLVQDFSNHDLKLCVPCECWWIPDSEVVSDDTASRSCVHVQNTPARTFPVYMKMLQNILLYVIYVWAR